MEVNVLKKGENHLRFYIRGIDTSIANALRRIMIAEVPSMAIDDVVIIENSSPLKDELLAHRLGLIPLKTDLDFYVLPEECTCNSELGCSKCSVTLTLDAEASEPMQTVFSKNLKSINSDIVPVTDNIPIVKFASGQRIRLEAYSKLGKGKDHAKWQPVSACAYKYASVIHIHNAKCDLCEKCVEICLKNVLKKENEAIVILSSEHCDLCMECVKTCPQDAIEIKKLNDAFIFTIESTGVLSPQRIATEAVKIMRGKADRFIEELSELE